MKKNKDKVYEWVGFLLFIGCIVFGYIKADSMINAPAAAEPVEMNRSIETSTFQGKIGDCQTDTIKYDKMADLDLEFDW